MLIKFFHKWIHEDLLKDVANLQPYITKARQSVIVEFKDGDQFRIDDKTCDEVAEEINKQLASGKHDK